MVSYARSYSVGDAERPMERGWLNRRNSIFASAWNLLVGRSDSKGRDTPDHNDPQGPKRGLTQAQEEAWMQGSYTALAFLFVFLVVCMFVAVYYILEPFLQALLWAVLVGMVIHPFKHATTSKIHDWLAYLDSSGIPLSVGLVLSPLFTFNWLAQFLERYFFSNWKIIFGVLVCIVAFGISIHFSVPTYMCQWAHSLFLLCNEINAFVVHTTWIQVASLVVGFVLLLFMSNSSHKTALKALSACLWLMGLLITSTYLIGSLAVPVVLSLFVASIVASFILLPKKEKRHWLKSPSEEELADEGVVEKGITVESVQQASVQESELEVNILGTESDCDPMDCTQEDDCKEINKKQVSFDPSTPLKCSPKVRSDSSPPPFNVKPETIPPLKQSQKYANKKHSKDTEEIDGQAPRHARVQAQNNNIFFVLLTACLLLVLWKHPIITLFLIPFAIWSCIKHLFAIAVVKNSVGEYLSRLSQTIASWFHANSKILVPWPMPMMYTLYLFVDKKIFKAVRKTIGSLVSALIIVLLLVCACAALVLFVLQIQVEVKHYADSAVSVWNSTLTANPQIREWMGVTEASGTLQSTLENFATENYAFIRERIARWIHTLVTEQSDDTAEMEAQVLEMVDKLYNVYVVQNSSKFEESVKNAIQREGGVNDDDSIFGVLYQLLIPHVDLSTTVSVLRSVWSIVSDNMTIALSFLYTLLQLLFSGGNFLINSIVFLTSLFYLLSYSGRDYLPVKWVMDLLPHSPVDPPGSRGTSPNPTLSESENSNKELGDKKEYGKTFSLAIQSVFHATFRRAFFYGFYTWLTHTLFGLPVAVLPAVLASIAGAIPFIGAYWVALPAVLELWLLEGQLLSALALSTFSVLPLFFVDNLINREIEGGHPYLTGLAIAGGIYFAGLQGALIGPILLSCLLFIVDFYGDSFF